MQKFTTQEGGASSKSFDKTSEKLFTISTADKNCSSFFCIYVLNQYYLDSLLD